MTVDSALILAGAHSVPTGELALATPSPRMEEDHVPVRGDLAHVRLAGQVFVPHYAVPMPYVVTAAGTVLLRAGRADAAEMARLEAGSPFSVLDIAGRWAWGQVGEDGLVGYVTLADLTAVGA